MTEISADTTPPMTTRHRGGADAGRIARIVTMTVVAAAFILPIIGFIAMAFRSNDGVAAGSGGFLGLADVSLANVRYSWSQVNGFGPGGGLFSRLRETFSGR